MRRLPAVLLAFLWVALTTAPVGAQSAPPPPQAWITVDAETGAVLDGDNVRERRYVASTIKLLTALIAVEHLGTYASVPVSERAAAMPARKLNMAAGETWTLTDTLHSLLLSSANDAAAALGERVSGTLEKFSAEMAAAGEALGLEDDPVLRDPSGLDDENSIGGGNVVSARDVAIIARAALADPTVAEIVGTREYEFTGPDGVAHHLTNHNKLLTRYDGAIGMKTGYTRKSGHTLVAAGERDGRQIITVVLGAVDMYGSARHFLDAGFATPPSEASGGVLPPVRALVPADELAAAPSGAASAGGLPVAVPEEAAADGPTLAGVIRTSVMRLLLGLVTTVAVLRTRVVLRQARRRRRGGHRVPRPSSSLRQGPPHRRRVAAHGSRPRRLEQVG